MNRKTLDTFDLKYEKTFTIGTPVIQSFMVPNVTVYGLSYYNKWYRRLWRWVRRMK